MGEAVKTIPEIKEAINASVLSPPLKSLLTAVCVAVERATLSTKSEQTGGPPTQTPGMQQGVLPSAPPSGMGMGGPTGLGGQGFGAALNPSPPSPGMPNRMGGGGKKKPPKKKPSSASSKRK